MAIVAARSKKRFIYRIMKIKKFTMRAVLGVALMTVLAGCTTPKNVAYFQDFDQVMAVETQSRNAITVKPDDKLQILCIQKTPNWQVFSIFLS